MAGGMDFDKLLIRFFGTDDFSTLSPEQMVAGVDRLRLQFSMEKDEEMRFALWGLMYMLGMAPDVEDAFDDEDDREAAREFMEMADSEIEDDEDDDES